ncbi:hypothetical protein C808_01163 [Lachnospiraceae bacterium M18-1]|nr:hypothetical protein C808_01163 [Lachnospiraceae bacterium M18-1]
MGTDRLRKTARTGCFFRLHISEETIAAGFAGEKGEAYGGKIEE